MILLKITLLMLSFKDVDAFYQSHFNSIDNNNQLFCVLIFIPNYFKFQ